MKAFLSFVLFVGFFGMLEASIEFKEHEKWWQCKCHDKSKFDQFAGWIGDENEPSRIQVRTYIINKGYKSVLDIPCGLCVDYSEFKKNCIDLTYLGIDITPLFVARANNFNIPAMIGRIQEIPCDDSSFDVTYSRHILEHLESYEQAIEELVRVARKEVLIVFFIKPITSETDRIVSGPVDGYPIYHNRYSKSKLEAFLQAMPKVKSFTWEEVNANECILHIIL